MKPLVTIITATTGTPYLKKNYESVRYQTYDNIQHLIVVDGAQHEYKVSNQIENSADVIVLPYATGTDQYNGHRIYGGCTYFAKGDYIIYLDEDNWLESEHVEKLVNNAAPDKWGFSFRKIADMDGNFICNDDCESLGNWESCINDYFVDVNCYFLPKKIALHLTPIWYRRARHPQEQPEVDRLLTHVLRLNKLQGIPSGEYSLNYRAGNRADSVQAQFFIEGNKKMLERHGGKLPWNNIK